MKRRPYVMAPAGRDALDELRFATDLVRDARESVSEHADRRGGAVLAARRAGVPYRRIAAEIADSVGAVQHIVAAALHREQA